VKWKNLLSTGNSFTTIFLDRQPTTLIVGDNGSGKSTILDALTFVLFNKPFRIVKKAQLVNSVNNSETVVEVEFEIGTRKYRVMRGIKPNKFEIYCNDKMVNQDASSRDYQKYLEQNILKLNYRSFTQVVILGNASFIPFMQLKSVHRREVVEEILDIKIFSLMNMLVKNQIKDVTDELRDIDYNKELTEEKIGLQGKYIEDLKKNKDKIIREKLSKIDDNQDIIDDKVKDRETLKTENEMLLQDIADRIEVEDKLVKLNDIKSTLVEKHKQHSKKIDFYKNNDECPECKQTIDKDFKENMITEKNKDVDTIIKGMKQLKIELDEKTKRSKTIKGVTTKIRENDVKVARLHSSITELEKFNTQLETEMKSFQEGGVGQSDEDKLKELKENLEKISEQRHKLREDKLYLEASKAMLQDSGIKTKIIKQYLPIMNKLINTYLTSMEFYVNFTLNENFEETIKSRYRDEFTYASFSEGEKMRIDLALLFTWRAIAKMKNSTNTNLLILDEIFDSSLDGTGTDEFLKILNTLSKENVFVISHKGDTLFDKFRSVIKFEKVKNFSHVS
jgi:DNA repair exonuclease SbcCD ATPase subunit